MARITDNEAMTIFAENLKRIMDEKGLDAPSLAQKLGLEKQSIYAWLKMNSYPSITNIQKLVDVLHVSSDMLLARTETEEKSFTPIPLYGRVAAGVPMEMLPVDDIKEAPARFTEDDPDAYLVRVVGNSMSRRIQDGDYALISPKYTEPNERDMFLVTVNGDDATIKRVRVLGNGIELIPDSYDPTYRPQVYDYNLEDTPPIRIIGKVVWWCAGY